MMGGCWDIAASHLLELPNPRTTPDMANCTHHKATLHVGTHRGLQPVPHLCITRVTQPHGPPSPGTSGHLGPSSRGAGTWLGQGGCLS